MRDSKTISADEKKWRAKSDADALRRAYEIESDKARHRLALKEMEEEIKEEEKKLNIQKKLLKK